jgi:hypothetical protein
VDWRNEQRYEKLNQKVITRYSWGAVSCVSATTRDKGPDCPMPAAKNGVSFQDEKKSMAVT